MKELIESVRTLTGSNGAMPRLVEAVKQSNALARGNNMHLKWVSVGLVLCMVILVAVSVMLVRVTKQVDENTRLAAEAISKLEKTDKKVEEVQNTQEATKTAEAEKSKVEIVPEMDPEKAKVAPIKVRITAPAHPEPVGSFKPEPKTPPTKASPPPTTVELPLPLEDAASQKK